MRARFVLMLTFVAGLSLAAADLAQAGGNNGFFNRNAVGGVQVDADGVLNNMTLDNTRKLTQLRSEALQPVSKDLARKTDLRKISLRRLAETIQKHAANKEPLPDEVKYLAGLQRIQYVFVYPDQQDIVLAGPGEGWKVNADGFVVGKTTGKPVLQLDDLVNALRIASADFRNPITVSIDPTQEGIQQLNQFLSQQGGRIGARPANTISGIEQALGPQTISFGNVPPSTRLARVLVAADYRMKRMAMGFDPSPVRGMKNFLQMTRSISNMFPRWWMTTNYDPLLKSPEGDAWELRGPGVKAMTEDSLFQQNGARKTTGRVNPAAQAWADKLTENFDTIAQEFPVFTELRNVMDLAVVATLIVKEGLPQKAGINLDAFLSDAVKTEELNPPKSVPTQASFLKRGSKYLISASGGVEISPLSVVNKTEQSESVNSVRDRAKADETTWQWYWN